MSFLDKMADEEPAAAEPAAAAPEEGGEGEGAAQVEEVEMSVLEALKEVRILLCVDWMLGNEERASLEMQERIISCLLFLLSSSRFFKRP